MFLNQRLVCFWYVFQSKVGTLFILSRSELKVMKSCVNLLYPPLYKCACYQVLTWCCQIKLTFEITENHCFQYVFCQYISHCTVQRHLKKNYQIVRILPWEKKLKYCIDDFRSCQQIQLTIKKLSLVIGIQLKSYQLLIQTLSFAKYHDQ